MLQVVAGIIRRDGKVCICQRPSDKHEGGKWEFPGGKIELGESLAQALYRELDEEVGIQIDEPELLCRLVYHYPEKTVCLNFLLVDQFSSEPWGKESQPLQWVAQQDLAQYTFPKANFPVIKALELPEVCQISWSGLDSLEPSANTLNVVLPESRDDAQYRQQCLTYKNYPHLLVADLALANDLGCGLVLTAEQLGQMSGELEFAGLSAAICRNEADIKQATGLKVDLLLLLTDETQSQQMLDYCSLPAYLLSDGQNLGDLRAQGAKGMIKFSGKD